VSLFIVATWRLVAYLRGHLALEEERLALSRRELSLRWNRHLDCLHGGLYLTCASLGQGSDRIGVVGPNEHMD
jgi:hypothetical protein